MRYILIIIMMISVVFSQESFEEIQLKANKGDVESQYLLGRIYYPNSLSNELQDFYREVNFSLSDARKWLKRAAEKGHVEAQYWLGVAYNTGHLDLEIDSVEALKWYKLASDQGYPPAQVEVAYNYIYRSNDNPDYIASGIKLLKLAGKHGEKDAYQDLGHLYFNGLKVRQDIKKAKEYFGLACDMGLENGCEKYKELNMLMLCI